MDFLSNCDREGEEHENIESSILGLSEACEKLRDLGSTFCALIILKQPQIFPNLL